MRQWWTSTTTASPIMPRRIMGRKGVAAAECSLGFWFGQVQSSLINSNNTSLPLFSSSYLQIHAGQQPEWGREESARDYLKEEPKKLENCDQTVRQKRRMRKPTSPRGSKRRLREPMSLWGSRSRLLTSLVQTQEGMSVWVKVCFISELNWF